MTNLDQKLEQWKNKLLDLGKRNRLLNYRDTKRSNLRIKTPSIFDLWNSFVVSEKSLEFDYFDDERTSLFGINEEQEAPEDSRPRNIVTNQTIKEQQKTLRNLRQKAKTAMEEQGVNILYLSFGFLKWSESGHSEQFYNSPIILVPVTLTIESITSPFVLSLHEDEIVLNPTLIYKLENDFGITLPEFTEETDLKGYLETIGNLVAINKWEVFNVVGLSLLSFLKINMYNDLETHKDKILSNPVVRALNGDTSALNASVEDINNFDHDKQTTPTEIFQVVDADSSQQDAVLFAKKGASFVLQGPPGTGKSQTITNIIAECLADGKKVLFVSEKMAALEVVQRRLKDTGLDIFCLVLHSYKANKKEILEQLASTLAMTKQKADLSDEAFAKLDLLQDYRKQLNAYAEAIFTQISPLDKTIYEVNGYIANLQSYEDIIFRIDDVLCITQQKLNRLVNLLNRFVETMGKKSDDYKNNPWNGANVQTVSNELRHDTGANLTKLIPKILDIAKLYDQIESDLGIEHISSYNGLRELIEILEIASRSPLVPISFIVGENLSPLLEETERYLSIKEKYIIVQSELINTYSTISNTNIAFEIDTPSGLFNLDEINRQIVFLGKQIDGNVLLQGWKNINDWNKVAAVFAKAKQVAENHNGIKGKLLKVFEPEIFEVDYKAMQTRFKSEYTSVFKLFNIQYKIDKRAIQGLYKEVVKKIDDSSIMTTLSALRKADEAKNFLNTNSPKFVAFFGDVYQAENTDFDHLASQMNAYDNICLCFDKLETLKLIASDLAENDERLKLRYNYLYNGINTDWQKILTSLNWAIEFRDKVEKYEVCEKFISNVCSNNAKIAACGQYSKQLTDHLQNIDTELDWFLGLFDSPDEIRNTRMIALSDRLIECKDGLALLEQWIDFRNARTDCQNEGLADFIEKIDTMQANIELITPMFKKRFYRLWLDGILPQYPAVMNFRRATQENTISNFANLDKLQFDIAKARIRKKLIDELPSLERFISGTDEISILKRELSKQRKIKPIRKLFREIPNLLLTLKPCLMMSPLSVSLFLEADSYTFDTIIFDEASQVCTENAIGAISRGKQVIIAGDSKQLPPTNFFTASTSDSDYDFTDDDEEDDDTNAYESILDEAIMLPERTLLWHYRSRHEHLIAFSNAKIYKNNLITFPSNEDKIADNGVEYKYVREGFYDRGGKKGNVIEAKKIAELIFDHFKRFPERSLGVIAFGEVQQQAIDTCVRQMRKENQQFEKFFNEDNHEAFFIKNLENVQGDERDTIIFSIGYAKDANGKMQMLFGPLSKGGGERRLNVAITRAKHNVKLVGSILPTDIEIERISADGPKLLRAYIDFAMNGTDVLKRETTESDIAEHDSPFETAVYNFLDRKGYKLGTQVGCSGYRIDMAVKHPTISGKYVLGIECDGAAYHSARTARERDRLRQSVLEDMGWKIYRIWSTDWIKDPVTEGGKLLDVVKMAIDSYTENSQYTSIHKEEIADESFISISEKEENIESQNPYNFGNVEDTSFYDLPRNAYGYLDLGDCITAIVANEFPVHYEVICKKVAPLMGNEKATVKIRREVDYALKSLQSVKRKGDFFFPQQHEKITPRTVGNTRSIEHISPDELAQAMLVIVSARVGITREALYLETARAYGFNRTGGKIQVALQVAYELILKEVWAKEVDEKLVLAKMKF